MALDLSAIRIKVQADTKEANKSLRDLKKDADTLAGVGKTLTAGVTLPIIGIGAASVKAAQSLAETQKKTETVFGSMTEDVRKFAAENERTYGLGAGTIEGYTTSIADLAQGLGMAKDESLEFSKGAFEVGVQLANWGGVDSAQAIEDVKRACMGSTEAVEKYGIKLNQTVLDEYTRNEGLGDSFNKLSEVEKAQVRYAAIVGSSGNAIEYWNEGNRSAAFTMGEIKEQMGNVSESIGAVLLPIVGEITKKIADLAANVAAWAAENPKLVESIVKFGGLVAILGPVIWAVSSLAGAFIAAGGAAGIAAAAIALLTSPITLIVAGVALLAAAIYYNFGGIRDTIVEIMGYCKEIIETVWNGIKFAFDNNLLGIKTMVETAFENIKTIISTVFDAIKNVFKIFSAAFKGDWEGVWNGIKDLVSGIWDGIKTLVFNTLNALVDVLLNIGVSLYTAAKNSWDRVWAAVKEVWNSLVSWFKQAINDPIGTIKNIGSSMFNAGKDMLNSVWEGCKSIWSSISGWFSEKVNWIKDKLTFWKKSKSEMGSDDGGETYSLQAPSQEMVEGAPMARGIIDPSLYGFKSNSEPVKINREPNVVETFKEALEGLKGQINNGVVETVINIDGREFARTTTPYISRELAWATR